MNDLSSPRLHVRIDGVTAPARVLAELKQVSTLGLAEVRSLIAAGVPVLDVEMFTNDWYDGGAARVLNLLSGWEAQGVGYILRETLTEPDAGEATDDAPQMTLDELRTIIRTSEEERARADELDDLRYGEVIVTEQGDASATLAAVSPGVTYDARRDSRRSE
ncbi:hypothetical protein [Nocardioides sp. AE5]|uniref:hypothetical protein n=1 Tax=Nocardioides sp. AE5 TaxID=2962573 RepID=UPI002880F656|nr:hypothetical protein [Nocardioides sp. AE5]MDT0202397.1 hypothetical protein [Nocardioides sp. AE5]